MAAARRRLPGAGDQPPRQRGARTWGCRRSSLGILARAESLALLRKHRPDLAPDDPVLDAIAAELGDLPLALHLAGSFLARYRHAPSASRRPISKPCGGPICWRIAR